MPSQSSIMSDNNVDNYDEGWYQDESGNWLNQYNWLQDSQSGDWYYDESYYPANSGSDLYEGWIQDANGEWIEDPNYDPGATKTSASAEKTQNSEISKSVNSSSSKSNGDVSNQKQATKDIEQNGVTKKAAVAATVTIKEDSTQSSDSKAAKLPPRPADYDYYWYQDEDGNWRNEYDDYG